FSSAVLCSLIRSKVSVRLFSRGCSAGIASSLIFVIGSLMKDRLAFYLLFARITFCLSRLISYRLCIFLCGLFHLHPIHLERSCSSIKRVFLKCFFLCSFAVVTP